MLTNEQRVRCISKIMKILNREASYANKAELEDVSQIFAALIIFMTIENLTLQELSDFMDDLTSLVKSEVAIAHLTGRKVGPARAPAN